MPDLRRPRLAIVHLRTALVTLLIAALWIAWHADAVATSVAHPFTLAAAHLLTLGVIAMAAVGGMHVAANLPDGANLPQGALDWWLYVALVLVASGVPFHMAVDSYGGVGWSAALLLLLLSLRLPAWGVALFTGTVPRLVALGLCLCWLEFCAAVVLGGVVAMDRSQPLLPAGHHHAVIAHAHLAVGGFAVVLAQTIALLRLPQRLPTAMTAIALAGTGLGALVMGALGPVNAAALHWGGIVLASGVGVFVVAIARVLPARANGRDGAQVLWFRLGGVCLIAAWLLGIALLCGVGDARLAACYGTLALVGCLCTLALGACRALLERLRRPPSPRTAAVAFAAWTLGLSLLLAGQWCAATLPVRLGALLLAVAALLSLLPRFPPLSPRPGAAPT